MNPTITLGRGAAWRRQVQHGGRGQLSGEGQGVTWAEAMHRMGTGVVPGTNGTTLE